MEVIHGRGYVYSLAYHIVWCTKYRRKVLTDEVSRRLKVVLEEYAADNGFTILEYNTDQDHVHLLISATPQVYIPNIMKGMKGVSARRLFQSFPFLQKKLYGGHLWNPSYFIATVSENTESQIRAYIQSQKER